MEKDGSLIVFVLRNCSFEQCQIDFSIPLSSETDDGFYKWFLCLLKIKGNSSPEKTFIRQQHFLMRPFCCNETTLSTFVQAFDPQRVEAIISK